MIRRTWGWAIAIALVFCWGCLASSTATDGFSTEFHRHLNQAVQPFLTISPSRWHGSDPEVPAVDPDRLFDRVKALAYERYTDRDRDRARTYILQQLSQFGYAPVEQPFDGGTNIVAQRPGTDPDAGYLLVGAHYDTVLGAPGADDNASGVAGVLEIARLWRSRPTRGGLKIVFFDLEERQLQGSLAFIANPENLTDVQGAIVLEMIGYGCHRPGCQRYPDRLPIAPPSDRGNFLAVIGDAEHPALLQAFGRSSPSEPAIVLLSVPLKGILMPDLLRSDHAPFWYSGIGAVMVTDTANFRNPHYHQPSDTPDTLDRDFFSGAVQQVANAVATLLDP